jgi:hypothetical protein
MEGKKIIAADYATGQAHLTTSEGKCCLEGTSYVPNVGSRNFHFHINNPVRSSSQPNPFFITVSIDDTSRLMVRLLLKEACNAEEACDMHEGQAHFTAPEGRCHSKDTSWRAPLTEHVVFQEVELEILIEF